MLVQLKRGKEGGWENRQQTQDLKYLLVLSLATSLCGVPVGDKCTEDKFKEMMQKKTNPEKASWPKKEIPNVFGF